MTWILISVAAPLLYAIANHTDKYLLERYFKGGEVGSFIIFSSFFYALNGVIFKMIAIDAGFWGSTFWEQSGKIILGILIFIFIRSYREQFLRVFKMNKFSVLSLNILNETVVLSADLLLAFAF